MSIGKHTCFLIASLLVASTAAPLVAADQVAWLPDLEMARQQALQTNRLIMVHFTGERCVPCRRLERNVYKEPAFGFGLAQQFVPVKINATASPDLARQFKVTTWPTDVILAPSGHELHRMTSPQDPKQYLSVLGQIAWRYRHMQAGTGSLAQFSSPRQQAQQQMRQAQVPAQIQAYAQTAATAPQFMTNQRSTTPLQTGVPSSYQQTPYAGQGLPRVGQSPAAQTAHLNPTQPNTQLAYSQQQRSPATANMIPASGGTPAAGTLAATHQLPTGASRAPGPGSVTNPYANRNYTHEAMVQYANPGNSAYPPSSVPGVGYGSGTGATSAATPASQSARIPDPLIITNEFATASRAAGQANATQANASQAAPSKLALTPPAAGIETARQVAASTLDNMASATKTAASNMVKGAASLIQTSNANAESASAALVQATPLAVPKPAPPNPAAPAPTTPAISDEAASPSSSSAFAMDGYCCVALAEESKWVKGDVRWGARHRGQVYLFQTAAAQQRFLSDPDKFSPMLAGYDPVVFRDTGKLVAGARAHGVQYQDNMYLFQGEESLQKFWTSPDQYAQIAYQAMMNGSNVVR